MKGILLKLGTSKPSVFQREYFNTDKSINLRILCFALTIIGFGRVWVSSWPIPLDSRSAVKDLNLNTDFPTVKARKGQGTGQEHCFGITRGCPKLGGFQLISAQIS